ncbi:hypothetical protein HELRODRAFT_159774 [Helobdella robusta]|uniref:Uncharacterized protein n=1 Tax=Helobdella robusta TaxID=6412 RepID=T1EPE1_HELRO|nr:hypothetical protein HELRODRAFT_159774 [Helobdella robusta]ESO13149.1 hypothetical protein HELRODRAFT_159774 [Helobdella robusta]
MKRQGKHAIQIDWIAACLYSPKLDYLKILKIGFRYVVSLSVTELEWCSARFLERGVNISIISIKLLGWDERKVVYIFLYKNALPHNQPPSLELLSVRQVFHLSERVTPHQIASCHIRIFVLVASTQPIASLNVTFALFLPANQKSVYKKYLRGSFKMSKLSFVRHNICFVCSLSCVWFHL